MPKFKGEDGKVFEVTEEHAEEVLRKQGGYVEVEDEPEPEVKKPGRPRKDKE